MKIIKTSILSAAILTSLVVGLYLFINRSYNQITARAYNRLQEIWDNAQEILENTKGYLSTKTLQSPDLTERKGIESVSPEEKTLPELLEFSHEESDTALPADWKSAPVPVDEFVEQCPLTPEDKVFKNLQEAAQLYERITSGRQ